MRIKTLLLFAAGYAAAEYGVFGRALGAVPEEFRSGVMLFAAAAVAASMFDRYYVTPRVQRQVREDG